MKLEIGRKVPDFDAYTHDGKRFHLYRYLGRPIWLIFYRYPQCPLCNLHLFAIQAKQKEFLARGLQIICIYQSPPSAFKTPIPTRTMPTKFALLADPEGKIFSLYGTQRSVKAIFRPNVLVTFFRAMFKGIFQGPVTGDLRQIPAHFLVAEDGVLEYAYYGKNIADHIPWKAVTEFLADRTEGLWLRQKRKRSSPK